MILRSAVSLALICSVERLLTSTVARRHSFNTVVATFFQPSLSHVSFLSCDMSFFWCDAFYDKWTVWSNNVGRFHRNI
ncbi:hypothetical protein BC940DRAFT_308432, partial [Gongronella butleri]